jgi:hypothetical protein
MNHSPSRTQWLQMGPQQSGQTIDVRPGKTKVLAQFDRSAWTVQIEYRLHPALPNVDMCGTVIVRVDHDPNPAEAENRWHEPL